MSDAPAVRAEGAREARKPAVIGLRGVAIVVLLCAVSLLRPGQSPSVQDAPPDLDAPETAIVRLPLGGDLSGADAEISGLAWRSAQLILLPQYPRRFPSGDWGSVLALDREDIEASIAGARDPLSPSRIPLLAPGIEEAVDGFEGYEAIAFDGDRVFVTVEADSGGETRGHLFEGRVVSREGGDIASIEIDTGRRVDLDQQCSIDNLAYEALTIVDGKVIALHEANGAANPNAIADVYEESLERLPTLGVDRIEYRVTDATAADASGRFWVTNYHYDRDCFATGTCPVTQRFGLGQSHRGRLTVERLVELEATGGHIHATDTAPLYLRLDPGEGRNWEGIARLDDRGFLVATDEYPSTILAFVPR